MKQRKLNRFFIYLFFLLIIAASAGTIVCDFKEIKYSNYVLPGVTILIALLAMRFFSIDGGHYKRKMNKAREKNRMLFAMIPELFTEEHPDEFKMQVDGDSDGEFGIEKGKIKKNAFISHIHPAHLEQYNKAYRQMLAGAAMTTANIQWLNARDEYIWCDYHMTAAYNDEGQIERIIGVLVSVDRKISSDRKSEQIIQSVKNVYSRMIYLDLVSDQYEYLLSDDLVYYNYDKTGSFKSINADYIRRYVKEEYRPRLRELLDPDYICSHLDADHASYLYEYRKDTEEEQWEVIEVILICMEDDRASQVLITVRDKMESQ
ncbi:MAG: PAS domain-containing protein [Eubacterium sp.]|nr:PAS domain-containing protein [Eubacterium sp.]